MGQEYSLQEKLYNIYWTRLEKMLPDAMISDYIRDFLTLKTGRIPNKDNVYTDFKKYYNEKYHNYSESFNVEEFLKELTSYGEYYGWFKFCNSNDTIINEYLIYFQKLKSTTVYPFLLSVFAEYFMYNNIKIDDVHETLKILVSYIMRRLLCEIPSNALNKVFAVLAKDVEKISDTSMHSKVTKVLATKIGKAIFPNDSLLNEKLLLRDIYKFPHIKLVLEQIELKMGKEIVSFDNITIEHIMPQKLTPKWKLDLGRRAQEIHEKYLNCIGNLTLTGYNQELSNKSFEEKKAIYINSNINITKEINSYDCWEENAIISRGKSLIGIVAKIWFCPDEINKSKN